MSRRFDFLDTYIEYTQELEAPEQFHLWVGLGLLSAVISRSVYLVRGYATIYPNLYIMLVAPSGVCKKGSALEVGVSLVKKLNRMVENKIRIMSEKVTQRVLTQFLSDITTKVEGEVKTGSQCLIYIPEATTFLGKDAIASGALATLTRLYECPDEWEYKTASVGIDSLYDVCLVLWGGSTPEWLFKNIPVEDMESGFFARIMVVAQRETPRKNLNPKLNKEVEKKLIEFLVRLRKVRREVEISPEGENYFTLWYRNREPPQDERFGSFYEREHDHVIKVAILLAASRGDLFTSNVIGLEVLQKAMMIVEKLKKTMHLAYEGIGEHDAVRGYDRVLSQIKLAGGEMEHSLLLRKNYYHYDTDGFKKVMELLEQTGRVRSEFRKNKRIYRLVRERKE